MIESIDEIGTAALPPGTVLPAGPIGPKGDPGGAGGAGPRGPRGDSAYQTAIAHGFSGSEEAWLASLGSTFFPEAMEALRDDMVAIGESVGTYATLALANAAIAGIPANRGVYVTDDGTSSGFWVKRSGVLVKESSVTPPATHARLVAGLDVVSRLSGSLSNQTTFGSPATLVAGTALTPTTYVFSQQVVASGFVSRIEGYAVATGNFALKRFSRAGDLFTQIGSDVIFSVTPGSFRFDLKDFGGLIVNADEYLGFFAGSTPVIGFTVAGTPRTPFYSNPPGGGNVSSLTDATLDSASRFELRIVVESTTDSINGLKADQLVSQRKASIFDQATANLVTSLTYGTTTTPVSGTKLSNTTYVFAAPFERSGFARYVEGFGLNGGGPLRLKRFSRAGDVFTQVGADFVVTIPAGYFKIYLETMGVWNVLAGEYWGFNAVNGDLLGLIGRTPSEFPRTPVYSNTPGGGNASTFSDPTVDSSSRYEIRLGVDSPTVSETRLARSELVATSSFASERYSQLAQNLYSPGLFFVDRFGEWADSDRRSMRSDLAGSNPVTVHGSPVGILLEKSGYGNRYMAPSNEARPTWVSNYAFGRPALDFASGANLVAERKGILNRRKKFSIITVGEYASLSGEQAIFNTTTAATTATVRARIGNVVTVEAGSRRGSVFRATDTGTAMQLVSPHTPGTNADPTGIVVQELEIDYEAGVANYFIMGQTSPEGQVKFTPVNGGYSDATDSALVAIGGAGAPFIGTYLEHQAVVDDVDDQETDGVYALLGKKYGIADKLKKRVRYKDDGPLPCLTNFWFNGSPILKCPSNKYLVGGVSSGGSVMSADYDFTGGISAPAIRHYINRRLFQNDDHVNQSFVRMPDGNVACAYTRHGAGPLEYWINKTTNPADPLSWGTPVNIYPQITTARSNGRFSYARLFYLAAEGKYYLIARDWDNEQFNPDGSNQEYWGFSTSTDLATWTPFRRLWGANRPYTIAVQNGPARIDFAFDEAHPATPAPLGPNNSVRHCYLEGGILYRTDGTACPKQTAWETADLATQPTLVFQGNPAGLGRAWVNDIAIDAGGVPVIGFVTFPQAGVTLYTNRRYRKATYAGGAWSQREICDAGGPLSQGTPAYSGDFRIDPANTNIIYGSCRVNAAGVPVATGGNMQMFRFVDNGTTFASTRLTFGKRDRFRPYVTPGLTADTSIVWWNEGTYGYGYDQWECFVNYMQLPN